MSLKDGQWMTPEWAAVELVERHFANLCPSDLVLEPSAGLGAFLKAVPADVPAIGVEIDPVIAARCRENTGRQVIDGDFQMVPLPEGITAVVGNPPFHVPTIKRFMERIALVLPEGGRCGLLLPAYAMQTHQTVMGWHTRFSIQSEVIPRRLFPRLRLPLLFVVFTREQQRRMIGFALYKEACDVDRMNQCARTIISEGKPKRGVWRALVEETLRKLGGEADLGELYAAIESCRPTENAWWKEKVRQVLQLHCFPVGRGRWRVEG